MMPILKIWDKEIQKEHRNESDWYYHVQQMDDALIYQDILTFLAA